MEQLKSFLLSLCLIYPLTGFGKDNPPPPPPIVLHTKQTAGKRAPSQSQYCYLYLSEREVCLSTSMPYICATIEVADIDGEIYSSIVVTPEESCGYIDIQPSSTITVTFDNGVILYGSN